MKIEIKYREKLELRQTSSKPKAEFASQQHSKIEVLW